MMLMEGRACMCLAIIPNREQRKAPMSDRTNIAWTDSTWSPWRGCSSVSAGCKNCYARNLVNRFGGDFSKRTKAAPATFNAPLKWNKKPWVCNVCGDIFTEVEAQNHAHNDHTMPQLHRRRVFLGSLMDWLDPEVPAEWLADVLDIVRRCEGLDFLTLTKRPQLWRSRLAEAGPYLTNGFPVNWLHEGTPPPNVWIGTSVEDQQRADERIPELLRIPAAVRFLSVEPLLEDLDIQSAFGHNLGCGDAPAQPECVECGHLARKVDWVILGGESGPSRRDCGVDAIVNVHDQCRAAKVPCFVKQDCALKPGQQGRIPENVWKCKEFPIVGNRAPSELPERNVTGMYD